MVGVLFLFNRSFSWFPSSTPQCVLFMSYRSSLLATRRNPAQPVSVPILQPVTNIGVCVFFTLNRPFCPSTSGTTSVRADSSILEEIRVMLSQSYATVAEISTLPRTRHAVNTMGNAMPCHCTGYDRHGIHILWNRETKGNQEKTETKKKTNRKNERIKKQTVVPPPRRRCGRHLKRTSWKKRKKKGETHHYL